MQETAPTQPQRPEAIIFVDHEDRPSLGTNVALRIKALTTTHVEILSKGVILRDALPKLKLAIDDLESGANPTKTRYHVTRVLIDRVGDFGKWDGLDLLTNIKYDAKTRDLKVIVYTTKYDGFNSDIFRSAGAEEVVIIERETPTQAADRIIDLLGLPRKPV